MKRVNIIIALVFVSLFALSACDDENEVNQMTLDQAEIEKMTIDRDVYEDDAWE